MVALYDSLVLVCKNNLSLKLKSKSLSNFIEYCLFTLLNREIDSKLYFAATLNLH